MTCKCDEFKAMPLSELIEWTIDLGMESGNTNTTDEHVEEMACAMVTCGIRCREEIARLGGAK